MGGARNSTSTLASVVRTVLCLSTVAYVANLLLTLHVRWSVHSVERAQYEALAASPVCSDPATRMRSEQVNNCAVAEQAIRPGALSPGTLALLETLQRLSLCAGDLDKAGAATNRCDVVVESLAAASTKILALLAIVALCGTWALRQYHGVQRLRATKLPLEEPDYPPSGSLPFWLRE